MSEYAFKYNRFPLTISERIAPDGYEIIDQDGEPICEMGILEIAITIKDLLNKEFHKEPTDELEKR